MGVRTGIACLKRRDSQMIWTGILMGLAGTLAMDIWAIFLEKFAEIPRPNWAMPGRWLGHVMRGKVFHESIGAAEEVPNERALGWGLHYGVGVLYGVLFVLFAGSDWIANPTFLPIWIFSLLTIAAGWFLLQPGMGMGWAAAKTPDPWKVRKMGLIAHTVFALGMFAGALI